MKRIPAARIRAVWLDLNLSAAEAAEQVGLTRANLSLRAKALGLPPRKAGKRWRIGPAQIAEFKTMWLRGDRITDMAQHFGVFESSIVYRCKSLGLPGRGNRHRHFAAGRESEFASMWEAGVSTNAIATYFNVAANSVRERARVMNFPPRRPRCSTLPIEIWLEMRLAERMALAAQKDRQAVRERMAA